MADIEKIKVKGTDYTVVDSTVPSHVRTITQQNVTSWNNKQDALVSGTNIKTINNESLLGNGNITIQGGGGSSVSISYDSNFKELVINTQS